MLTKGCDVIAIPDSETRDSGVLDVKDEIQKPRVKSAFSFFTCFQ